MTVAATGTVVAAIATVAAGPWQLWRSRRLGGDRGGFGGGPPGGFSCGGGPRRFWR